MGYEGESKGQREKNPEKERSETKKKGLKVILV